MNWFKIGADGSYLWPGFGENCRVLKWIFERTTGVGQAVKSPIGWLPAEGALDMKGLKLQNGVEEQLFEVDSSQWLQEIREVRQYFTLFGEHLPPEFHIELDHLEQRLIK